MHQSHSSTLVRSLIISLQFGVFPRMVIEVFAVGVLGVVGIVLVFEILGDVLRVDSIGTGVDIFLFCEMSGEVLFCEISGKVLFCEISGEVFVVVVFFFFF